jgi:hypothetical protein
MTTTSTPSIRAATTVAQSGPGLGTSASRSSAMPTSAAATAPKAGTPTTAHHDPERDASDSSASTNEVPPTAAGHPAATATVLPRRSPRAGSRPRSGTGTGSARPSSGAGALAGRTRPDNAADPSVICPAIHPLTPGRLPLPYASFRALPADGSPAPLPSRVGGAGDRHG